MVLNLQLPETRNLKPTITVFGVGGAGGNAVDNMIESGIEGVKFVVANTDSQSLEKSLCPNAIQLGVNITQGLGAGSHPEVGKAAAEESTDEILDHLEGSNMVFVTAGMGGGTGTGAAPVVARLAREQGILTVGVVTKPFHFEGTHRMRMAELGLQELHKYVDTMIVIPNQNLFRVADKNTTFKDAFRLADNVLKSGVHGITDLMIMPGLVNLDFADVRSVMSEMGKAMMGTGESEGENRAIKAAEAAIANPLLDNVSMQGARGVLINISGGADMTLFEVDEAANRIREEVDENANIIFGSTFDTELEGKVRVSVVATGIDSDYQPEVRATHTNTRRNQAPKFEEKEVPSYAPQASVEAPSNSYEEEDFSANSFIPKEPAEPTNQPPVFANPQRPNQASQTQQAAQKPSTIERPGRNNREAQNSAGMGGLFGSIFSSKKEDARAEQNSETTARKTSSQYDDDQLDIPAYLRRKG